MSQKIGHGLKITYITTLGSPSTHTHTYIYIYIWIEQHIVVHCSVIVILQSSKYKIQIEIQIECLHGTLFLDPDRYLDGDLDNFAPY